MANNGTTPTTFDTSGNVSYTSAPTPVAQNQSTFSNLEQGYTSAINAQPTVPQLTNAANSQFGVPQLQGQVQDDQATQDKLNTQINMVPKTIAQASQQSIMTDGQKTAAEQAMTTPLQTQLATATTDASRAQTNLGTAQTNASNQVAAAQAQETKQLLPWTQAFSDANVIAAQNMTGWTTEDADQLSVLLNNQKTGESLTQDEQDHLESLASQEQTFEDTLKTNANTEQLNVQQYQAENPDPLGLMA